MPQKHKNRLFSPLNVPFYKLEPVCTAASLPPKPHFVIQHAFRVTPSHWITTCPLHCLFPPMNQPATPPKRPQFPIYRLFYRFFSSCPPFSMLAKKIPAKLFSPSGAPKLPLKNESITRTIVSAIKKHLPVIVLPQHSPQKHPEAPPCSNTSKQALTTSPAKHLSIFQHALRITPSSLLACRKNIKTGSFPP